MTEESIPELLARLEREHRRFVDFCDSGCGPYPCAVARLVAHIRSLEAAIRCWKVEWCGTLFCEHDKMEEALGDLRAALGEAQ